MKFFRQFPPVLKESPRKRPDCETLACVNAACPLCRPAGASPLVIRQGYGHNRRRRLRCRPCGAEVSERHGTAWCTTQLPAPKAEEEINHLAAGDSVRATARLGMPHGSPTRTGTGSPPEP